MLNLLFTRYRAISSPPLNFPYSLKKPLFPVYFIGGYWSWSHLVPPSRRQHPVIVIFQSVLHATVGWSNIAPLKQCKCCCSPARVSLLYTWLDSCYFTSFGYFFMLCSWISPTNLTMRQFFFSPFGVVIPWNEINLPSLQTRFTASCLMVVLFLFFSSSWFSLTHLCCV